MNSSNKVMNGNKTQCPRCKIEFDTGDAISSTLVCPECMFVFTPEHDHRDQQQSLTSSILQLSPDSSSRQLSAAEIVAKNSEAAAVIIEREISNPPSSSNETSNSNHNLPVSGNETIVAKISNPAQLEDGDIVGSYRIEKVLGQGAMGVVLLVIDELLNRKAALKFIGFELAKNKNCRDRFIREGRMLAKLSAHPNLVSVYSGGEWMGVPYFTMAYIKGLSLNDMLKVQSPIPLLTAVIAARDTALALDFVWKEAKLVHRDIKPANLMYDDEKELTVVTDFGLAKPDKKQFDNSLTIEGAILGTPDYISPEQIRCVGNLDWRADLYSLGCTLFHLLTGKAPFTGNSIGDLIAAHLKEPVPHLKDKLGYCPEGLSELLQQMMAKNRNDRPLSYEEVISKLDSYCKI